MAMAKALKGETSVEAARLSELAAAARDAMQARGKAELGGKDRARQPRRGGEGDGRHR